MYIRRVDDWFDWIGHWALMVGYCIAGVGHFTAIVAGTSKLELRSFALFAYTGALMWVSTFVFIGYHFGPQWTAILQAVEHNVKLASIALGAVVIAYLVFRLLK